jgi:hypothetical protein
MNVSDLNKLYPYAKPTPPTQLWALGLITVGGLIALFFAAFHAFSLVAMPTQAFFAAVIIEAGLVVEALALINKPKTLYPWLGLLISFLVSGTYNYVQAASAGQDLASAELLALAFGPLSALAVVSLTFGNELRDYQERIAIWEDNRAMWVDNERMRLERKEDRQREKSARNEAKNTAQDRAKFASNSTQKTRMDSQAGAQDSEEIAQNGENTPPLRAPKSEWRTQALDILRKNSYITGAELGRKLGASPRTGQNILSELEAAGTVHKNGSGWEVN